MSLTRKAGEGRPAIQLAGKPSDTRKKYNSSGLQSKVIYLTFTSQQTYESPFLFMRTSQKMHEILLETEASIHFFEKSEFVQHVAFDSS